MKPFGQLLWRFLGEVNTATLATNSASVFGPSHIQRIFGFFAEVATFSEDLFHNYIAH